MRRSRRNSSRPRKRVQHKGGPRKQVAAMIGSQDKKPWLLKSLRFISRESQYRTIWEVHFQGKWYRACYNKRGKVVVYMHHCN